MTVPQPVRAKPELPKAPIPPEDRLYLALAREVAMDIHPLETILATHRVTTDKWNEIKENPRFDQFLRAALEEWNSALNTAARVKIKALACVEEAMPEFFGRMHDPNEALPAKVKSLEVFANLAGLSKNNQVVGGGGEKFSVTINLGEDQQLKISAPSPEMIDVSDK
jgi:hypothetical protein